jgi:hypothetical protein
VVCSYCRHILVKNGEQYGDSGEVSAIADDISPFQIGSEGWFNGVHFGLVGRLRMAWADGFWNEWYAYFDDGRFGWLAEAQGTVAILFDITDPEVTRQVRDQLGHYESPDHMLGGEIVINSVHLLVSDIKKSECVVVEGETPRMSSLGTHYTAIDFMGTGGEIATAEFMAQPSAQRIFLGQYVTMADLRLTNLREIAGWQDR